MKRQKNRIFSFVEVILHFLNLFQIQRVILLLGFCFGTTLGTSCGSNNIYKGFSKQDSDKALLIDAKQLINKADYDGALTKLNAITTSFRESADTKISFYETHAAASAGKCGLDFVAFTTSFSGSSNLVTKTRDAFLNRTVLASACDDAQADMEAIGTNTQRDSNQNFFMAVLGLAKMGTYLRAASDFDNNGLADPGWSGCSVDYTAPPTQTGISDADVAEVLTGMGLLLDNIAAIGANVAGLDATAVTNFDASCKTLTGLPSCSFTHTSDITAPVVKAFRKFIDSTTDGIGNCAHQAGGVCCTTDP